jgi:hypothetical protein
MGKDFDRAARDCLLDVSNEPLLPDWDNATPLLVEISRIVPDWGH